MRISIFSQGNTHYAAGRNYSCSRTGEPAYGLFYGRQRTFTDDLIAYDFRYQHVDGCIEVDTHCKIGGMLCDNPNAVGKAVASDDLGCYLGNGWIALAR